MPLYDAPRETAKLYQQNPLTVFCIKHICLFFSKESATLNENEGKGGEEIETRQKGEEQEAEWEKRKVNS